MPRRRASSHTAGMIGRLPDSPVPTISRLPPQGIGSAADSGVWPNSPR
jgi:hypothetical protein